MQTNRKVAAVVASVASLIVIGVVLLNTSTKPASPSDVTHPQLKPTALSAETPQVSRHKRADAIQHQPSSTIPQLPVEQVHSWYVRTSAQDGYWNKVVAVIRRHVSDPRVFSRVEQIYEDHCGQLRVSAGELLARGQDRTIQVQLLTIVGESFETRSAQLETLLTNEQLAAVNTDVPGKGWMYACLGDLPNFERYKDLAAAEDAASPIIP